MVKGFLNVRERKVRNIEYLNFASEYLDQFAKYISSRGDDLETYSWLLKRSNKFQNQMGSYGVLGFFKPPYQNYQIRNYPVIVNILPEIRKLFNDRLFQDTIGQYVELMQNMMVSYIGVLENYSDIKSKEILNPIIWFREGIKSITSFPVFVLNWIGVISITTLDRMTSNFLFKFLSRLVALAGLVSAVMTIALGWDQFSVWFSKTYSELVN